MKIAMTPMKDLTGMNVCKRRGQRGMLRIFVQAALFLLGVYWIFSLFHEYPESRTSIRRKRVGKVLGVYGNHSIYERTLATHKEHSRRLGYPLHVLQHPILDGYWNKLAVLLSAILQELEKPADERLEWIFWSDADTVLMNPNMPLETFLPPLHFSDIHLLLTKDWNGMNNGVFPIRVHPWSVQFLASAISYPIAHPDVELHWPDQSAMQNLLQESDFFARSVVYCPPRWFNAYMRSPNGVDINPDSPAHLQVHPGDLLVHFPGTPSSHLEQTLEPYLAIAEAHQEAWEPPLERTGYMYETEQFWKKIEG